MPAVITGLYVAIPVYFVLLGIVAYLGWRRTNALKHKSDALTAHYLGGRSFGPIMTAGTMFASLFSGYTVVGVPNEAFTTGWASLRWFPSVIGVVGAYAGTGYRLRKCSLMRNHQSPGDFITDRFRSQSLRYTILLLQAIPSIIYLSAQVIAIKQTFNSIFEINPDSPTGVIIIFVLILIFEWTGGLVSVAATDAIQGFVMCLAFLSLPAVIHRNYGGWSDLDPNTYPQPKFYQNPTARTQWLMWNFGLVNVGFFSLPHLLQRTYAARDLTSLKWGYSSLSVGAFFTWLPGIFLGTVGVQMLADAGVENPSSPFASVLEQVMALGGFAEVVGVIAFTASLAAIMSTADSIIIAIR
jgi:Na+/proline symporter